MNNISKIKYSKYNNAITLISLIITIIILIILAGIAINLSIGENGLFNKAKYAKEETNKQTATEKINLKITTAQIDKYAKEQRMPTLKELSIALGDDEEIQYVTEVSQIASTKYEVGENPNTIFTRLKQYPYEFEINSELQLASINGIKVASSSTVSKDASSNYSTTEQAIGIWIDGKTIYRKVKTVNITSKDTSFDTEIPKDFDVVVNTKIIYHETQQDRYFNDSYYLSNSDRLRYWMDSNHSTIMHFQVGSEFPKRPGTLYVIIEYTKK